MNTVLRNIIVTATTEMLDAPDQHGIYPTGKFYERLEKDIEDYIKSVVAFGMDAGVMVQDDGFKDIIVNLSKQTSLTGRLQNAIASYLEHQSAPIMTIKGDGIRNADVERLVRSKK